MAKGYWIARVDVDSEEEYARYRALNAVAFAKYGAKFLVRGGEYKLARGEGRKHNVVLEFKDEATARACYASPEYQEAVKHLALVGKVDLVIIGGYDGAQPGE
ncbi:MAG: DUF1330 domain-containing protein [Bosea sp. (in: a-proteobacteria)]|jgi:uncharacterized protein (DUF1330 family)|uniref:DUF1330 domain-containing protein n=1 Tax=Alphaproteobacteria TaxID=28211 RepID=UPI00083D6648|nr:MULTISPECIES: DUF1330 domain-containing protein [Alphaproteobacteria]MBA4270032.1 DUF1330 domain-containing protein [Methylobacterium sp.]OYW62829.1 MAG: hypothetical protein B7Z40_16140 [Bosea sp. 12-68-7]OYW97165.1 MAG: hypothetical protein B7Z14_18420 [Bosea sp. 32-68-6]AOG06442.1 hypothetical protein BSY19_1262 [Bosea sp. RAC05]MBA4334229.1 DUF1330 domain-containing protein [Methylobacterium sp.]